MITVLDLFVDERYRGPHGIGRYATEVLSRLGASLRPIGLEGKPGTAGDPLRRLPRGVGEALVYSPGYAPLLRAGRQLLTVHDLIHLEVAGPRGYANRAFYNGPVRRQILRCGMVLTVSRTSADAIENWLGNGRVDIVNAGIGAAPEFTTTGPSVVEARPYLVYVGNLRAHKNVVPVLDALMEIPQVHLKAVLPIGEHQQAESLLAQRGLSSRVELHHNIDDGQLASVYRGASATLMPSLLEGFGLPALESIRCGTPVIYWKGCAAVAETVGSRGWAIDAAADPDAWGAAIATAADHLRRVEPPAESDYDWDLTAAKVDEALRRAAAS